jgi:hypothetical protein
MVSTQTINARDAKKSERRRLIQQIEKEIGTRGDYPEDEEILLTRFIFIPLEIWPGLILVRRRLWLI